MLAAASDFFFLPEAAVFLNFLKGQNEGIFLLLAHGPKGGEKELPWSLENSPIHVGISSRLVQV